MYQNFVSFAFLFVEIKFGLLREDLLWDGLVESLHDFCGVLGVYFLKLYKTHDI